MSKKQFNRKKISLRLQVEETALVLPYDIAMHIAETYDFVSMDAESEYVDYYKEVADMVRLQANENHYQVENDEDEEW